MENQENLFSETQEEGKETDTKEIIASNDTNVVIPVIHEFLTVDKKIIETGKIYIRKRIEEEIANINIPLVHEGYNIERVPVKSRLFDDPPTTIERDGNMIIPVVREVAQVVIRYEVSEEIHVTRHKREVPHQQQITLLKERIEIDREELNQ